MSGAVDVLADLRGVVRIAKAASLGVSGNSARIERAEAAIAAVAEMIAERATLEERWFMCCHPAWPDPLPCYGGREDALRAIREHAHPDAWLLRELSGGRVEYRGADLAHLAACGGAK